MTTARSWAIRRRDNGHSEPPVGILELHETIEEGRDSRGEEETGLIVQIDQLTGVYKNMTHGIVDLVFRCSIIANTIHPTPEASEVTWLTLTSYASA